MAFALTDQQSAFITALTTTSSHLALIARAGCGKTSTILRSVDELVRVFPRAEIVVCAYSKAIADEVATKLKDAGHTDWRRVQAGTVHSMGFGLVKFVFKPTIDDKKVRNIVAAQNDYASQSYPSQVEILVRLAKQAGVGFFPDSPIGDVSVWYRIAEHFDVNGFDDTSEADAVIDAAMTAYRTSLAQTSVIDFDDMILFPLIKNLRVKFGKDFIILDEAQDLSRARQALARKFLKPHTGRMVIVGDDRQSIFGFSGADSEALPNMIRSLNATVLPLSVTWRCPKAVVALAQTIGPDIEAAPSAPEGEVKRIATIPERFEPTDAILCRSTAPLVSLAYKLIRNGNACKVEGRAIGEGLLALVRRWKVKTVDALINRLEAYQDREIQKAMAKGNEAKVEEIEDRVGTLMEIIRAVTAKKLTAVSDVEAFITDLFADGATGVTILATYHRSKGREWPRVFLLEHEARCPSKYAKQDWQLRQEENLAYVAFTRAQQSLTFIN